METWYETSLEASGFREDFLEINQSETRMGCGGHVF
jgi:hypothetical protein